MDKNKLLKRLGLTKVIDYIYIKLPSARELGLISYHARNILNISDNG